MIFGFPWENERHWLETADKLSSLDFDFLKIHQLHVVKETALADMYKKESFQFMAPDVYMDLIAEFLERLNPKIVIQRLFGEAPPRTLIAPHWGIRNTQLVQMLDNKLEEKDAWQGKRFISSDAQSQFR
jgi:radical SAM superfamily enzyme